MNYYGITNKSEYLAHAGKKGMKWGYTDGVRNGKRTAEEIEEALNQLKEKLQGGANDASEKAKEIKEVAKKKVEDISSKAKDLVTNVKTATVREITDAANKGRAIVDRLMTGEKKVTVSEYLSSKRSPENRSNIVKTDGSTTIKRLPKDLFKKKKTFDEWNKTNTSASNKSSKKKMTVSEYLATKRSPNHKEDRGVVFNVNDPEFKKRAKENNTLKPDIVFNVSDPEFKRRAKENSTLKPDIVFDVTDRTSKKKKKRTAKSSAPSRGVYFTVGPDGQTIRER